MWCCIPRKFSILLKSLAFLHKTKFDYSSDHLPYVNMQQNIRNPFEIWVPVQCTELQDVFSIPDSTASPWVSVPLPTTIILLSFQRQYKLYTPTSPLLLKLSVCVVCFSLRKRTFKIIFSRETDCTQLRVSEFFISPVYLTIAKPLLSARQYTGQSFGP